ncbi:MAG: T9SS type A sorting domain-containing protein [Candidatus Eisenbacteria sp.]|nr:T9SS type A sorting domain-containing protein [Candidatus Eisenbacteria bacterium]
MRIVVLCAISILLFCSTTAAEKPPPPPPMPPPALKLPHDLSQPLTFKQGGDTVWLQVYTTGDACECHPQKGGECSGGPDETETFCFENYNPNDADSLYKYYGSPGTPFFAPSMGNGFSTADLRTYPAPDDRFYWHPDTYQAYSGQSWWCGTSTGTICTEWGNAPGYGDLWNQMLTLDPDLDGVAPGDTVQLNCWVRYDLECDYDYAYIQYSNDAAVSWTTLAMFNGSSGNLIGSPCGDDYYGSSNSGQGNPPGGNVSWMAFPSALSPEDGYITVDDPAGFLIGFRFDSDGAWSDEDGRGNTDGALFIDHVLVTKLNADTLEFEDMDSDFEPDKWDLLRPPHIANHWWMPYDPDPPDEPSDPGGPTVCESNASWMWCATPFINNRWRIPPESNGFFYRLTTPRISLDWGEPDVPQEFADVVCQHDLYVSWASATCDEMDGAVRVYRNDKDAWCEWERLWTGWWWYPPDYWMFDYNMRAYDMINSSVDSIQFAWDVWDNGNTGDWCWTTQVPPPHKKTRLMVDNVSFGLYDRSATRFYAREIDMFQDTFDLETAAHNALCANADMPKILAPQESLHVDIYDLNGLAGPISWVRLYFSTNRGSAWDFNDLILKDPAWGDPGMGGTYVGSIHPSEIDIAPYPNATWISGTEIWYYIEVKDDTGQLAYWPRTAAPGTPPPSRPYFDNCFEFSILPGTPGLGGEPWRFLLVDDYGRTDYDFHPCMAETTLRETEDFYEPLVGFCDPPFWCSHDKYDINGASTGLSNEPWDIVVCPDPQNPDSLVRQYDSIVWFTSRFDHYTVLDTMQCRLVDFVRKGGNLFICGNGIGVEMTDYGYYGDAAAETCDFYSGLLGAEMAPPGYSAPGIRNPYLYAKGSGLIAGSAFDPDDRLEFHLGCPVNARHDRITITENPPCWAPNPRPYLVYESEAGYDAGDTVVAIYNEFVDGGKVVYMCLDLSAIVDSSTVDCPDGTYRGRANIMRDILLRLFLGYSTAVPDEEAELDTRHAYSLDQNLPNPFNPETQIRFSVRDRSHVSIKIYDVTGRVVRTLVDEAMQPGPHQVHWDGANDHGQPVATGMYFCRMSAGEFTAVRKMVMLK